ncbi:LysR substrate-binding domain-containing protein [Zooshikella sp. RANM57]|uniref:LysR substrate-binding domain-containing protein n=1 Tax=Zooshikella sp. RANM57 TaxID=3425863 RepID=UPI003D6F211A
MHNPALLDLLHTFKMAAQFMSFTKAGEALHMTQAAVSHRIKRLEEELGFKLFIRLTRKLKLTKEGEQLLVTLTDSLLRIEEEIEDIRRNDLRGLLYIGISPTFAQLWVMPRLARFQQLYPALSLRLRIKASALDFRYEPVDLGIYYGRSDYRGVVVDTLLSEQLVPVCTPEYAERHQLYDHPERLSQCLLLHCSECLDHADPRAEWLQWQQAVGIGPSESCTEYFFNHYHMTLQATLQHMGIAMGRLHLVADYLASGTLVTPIPQQVPAGLDYTLIYPREHGARPRYQTFIRWLHDEITQHSLPSGLDLNTKR